MSAESNSSDSSGLKGAVERAWPHVMWLVLLAALLVRLPTLFSRPLWYDEAFAVLFSAEGPRAMSYGTLLVDQGIAADVHPLGYYTLLWVWQAVAGVGPVAVRALSVILGLALVFLGYRLSRRLFQERIAIVAALMFALSPFQVHYSQGSKGRLAPTLVGLCRSGSRRAIHSYARSTLSNSAGPHTALAQAGFETREDGAGGPIRLVVVPALVGLRA